MVYAGALGKRERLCFVQGHSQAKPSSPAPSASLHGFLMDTCYSGSPREQESKQGKLWLTGHPGPKAQNLGQDLEPGPSQNPCQKQAHRGEQAPGDMRCPPCFLV